MRGASNAVPIVSIRAVDSSILLRIASVDRCKISEVRGRGGTRVMVLDEYLGHLRTLDQRTRLLSLSERSLLKLASLNPLHSDLKRSQPGSCSVRVSP